MASSATSGKKKQTSSLPGNPRKSELRDGMQVDWDVSIPARDGLVLKADVFRPPTKGKYPVIMTYGPYGKGLAFQEGYRTAWEIMARDNPDAVSGTSNRYQNWEVVDPEKGRRLCGQDAERHDHHRHTGDLGQDIQRACPGGPARRCS